jgi:hypothetical protein
MTDPARVLFRNPSYDGQLVRTLAAARGEAPPRPPRRRPGNKRWGGCAVVRIITGMEVILRTIVAAARAISSPVAAA